MDTCVYVWVELVAHLYLGSSAVGNAGTVFPLARMLTENS